MGFGFAPPCLLIGLCVVAGAARADSADPTPVSEVVVTAKISPLQPTVQSGATFIDAASLDVPATLSIVPESLLRERGITSLDDALRNVPGIQVGQGADNGRAPAEDATARGFAIASANTFRDGLRQFSYTYVPVEFYERIEVLKGLSALQAGFIGPAGLIDFVTKRPQPGAFLHTDGLVTNWGGGRLMADVNIGDVGGGLGLRAVGVYEDLDNQLRGFGGRRLGGQLAATIPLPYRTTLDLDVSHTDSTSSYQSPIYYFNGAPTALPRVDRRTFWGQTYSGYPNHSTEASGRITHVIDDHWKLVLAGSIQRFSRFTSRCGQASLNDPDPVTGEAGYDVGCEPKNSFNKGTNSDLPYNNAEARLTGDFRLFDVRNDIAVGYQYSYFSYHPAAGNYFYTPIDSAAQGIFTQNVFTPRRYDIPTSYVREPRTSFNYYTVTDQGLYAQDRLSFGSQWQLWLGGRYVRFRNPVFSRQVTSAGDGVAIVDNENRVISGDGSTVLGDFVKDPSNSYAEDAFTPSAALVFKPVASVSLYASYSEGLEQGGTAPDTARNAGQVFGPIRSTTYEAGAKWDIGQATLTAAAFHIKRPLEVVNSQNVFTQGGVQRHEGIELSASGRLTSEISLLGGLLLLDAKQKDVNDPALEGRRPAGVADLVANVYAEYAPRWAPGLTLSAGDYHLGDQYLFGDGAFKVPGHDRIDIGARYAFTVRRTALTARINVQNLADSYFYTVDGTGGGSVYVGAPRTVRLSLSADF